MNTMFLRHIFMAPCDSLRYCGFCRNVCVSSGDRGHSAHDQTLQFWRTDTDGRKYGYTGVLTGAVFSVMEWKAQLPYPWLAHVILGAYGTAAGIFVGCTAVALAEILNTFPILFRRLYINRGLSGVMIAMALGKMAGSFYYFFFGYGLPKYW